jgi:malonyl-CoA/methylmalonyl-CoA synthetase
MTNPLYDQLFGRHAENDTAFLRFADETHLTYSEFLSTAARFAQAITAAGLDPGDRLAAQVEKSADALALYAACTQAGVVFLPLNTAYTPDELLYFVADSGAGLLVCEPSRKDVLSSKVAGLDVSVLTLAADGSGTLIDAARGFSGPFPTVPRSEDDLAAFLYTSGTTGRSKGAMLTQRNLLYNATSLVEHWQFARDDVLMHALPIFHTHGLFVATNITLMAGGSMIFLPKFEPDTILRLLPDATAMMGVPTFYTRLLDDPRFTRELTEHMRLFISGSAPLLEETHRAFKARTGHAILERYGMTETNMNTSNPYDGERRAGTVGMALPGVEVRVTDPDTGTVLPKGDVGQIEVRGPNVFKGYWRMPEKTAAELRPDGFFLTGDLGRIDQDGYIHIVGRSKDLIISGGYNIYPKEIELILDAQPGVKESAVFGVPHSDFGETVVGVVVPDGSDTLDHESIQTAVAQSLARFKHPRKIVEVDALPRNAMGKVQKNMLRETYRGLFD